VKNIARISNKKEREGLNFMKNMRVPRKLIVSFLIVIVLTGAVGVFGIYGMIEINSGVVELYERQTLPLVDLSYAREYFQRLRSEQRNLVMASGDLEWITTIEGAVAAQEAVVIENMQAFSETIIDPAVRDAYDYAMAGFGLYMQATRDMVVASRAGLPQDELLTMMRAATPHANVAAEGMTNMMIGRVAQAAQVYDYSLTTFTSMLVIIIVVLAVAVAVAMTLALYISSIVGKPLVVLDAWLHEVAADGNTIWTDDEKIELAKYRERRDEIGKLFSSFAGLIESFVTLEKELVEVASGNLDVEVKLRSDKDTLSITLRKMIDDLNHMFSEISNASGQVSAGSKQISDGAQSLAQGSTQQAASVQQLSASISDIAAKTKTNAEMAGRAATLASNIKSSAEKGNGQMDEMMTAVKDINESSQNISKVIKSIDDIAFQTNILALNAAVEAARAGQHGKGFAVVAEEVRNLAAKSAEAAKDTESLIADSISKAELGSRIADETSESLKEIVSGIEESTRLVGDIARSSEEQTVGIDQINNGVDQVAQVVQQNSATAQESAAASEEMSGQSLMLEGLVSRFKLKNAENVFGSLPAASSANTLTAPKKLPEPKGSEGDTLGDFGKY